MVYKALKSTDAEIILDLEKGKAFFDYSKNSLGSPFNSNTSAIIATKKTKDIINIIDFIFSIFGVFIFIIGGFIEFFGFVITPKHQYIYQKCLKLFWTSIRGYQIQTCLKTNSDFFVFHIDNNIWFDYVLEGDFQKNIKKISLLRHFETIEHFKNVYQKQNGWDVIFTFNSIPKNGSIILRSTR